MKTQRTPVEIRNQSDLDGLSEGDIVTAVNEGEMVYTEKGYRRELIRRRSPHRIIATEVESRSRLLGCTIKEDGLHVGGRIWSPHNGNCKPYNRYQEILAENGRN